MRILFTLLFVCAATIFGFAVVAKADPSCGIDVTGLCGTIPDLNCAGYHPIWYDPCHNPPPVPGRFWTPIDGVPGTVGPHGYTPIKG